MSFINSTEFKDILPLATLVVGWLLSELSGQFRSRGSVKSTLSKVLSELLEIHHQLCSKKLIVDAIEKRAGLRIDQIPEIQEILELVQVDLNEISMRYTDAVTLLSHVDAILAFKLRNKDKITPMISKLRNYGKENTGMEEDINRVIIQIEDSAVSVLEESILAVASKIGIIAHIKARRIIKLKQELVDDALEQFTDFLPSTN